MNKILRLEIIGFIVCSILGVVLHFAYEWSNYNVIVGLFCPVNESVFEHLKLIFFPYIIYGMYENIKLSNKKFNICFSKLIGVLAGIFTTLSIYYIVYGITEKIIDWINILSFFVGVLIAFIVSYNLIKKSIGKGIINGISCGLIIVIAIAFIFFTLYPIKIQVFQSPTDYSYGLKNK